MWSYEQKTEKLGIDTQHYNSILTFLLQVGQPSPGAKLHPWCSPRESTVEAWPKASHGQYFVLYISLMLLISARSSFIWGFLLLFWFFIYIKNKSL